MAAFCVRIPAGAPLWDERDEFGRDANGPMDERPEPCRSIINPSVRSSRPSVVVSVVCLAEILSMTPFSMFLALQPRLETAWALSNTETGWISSAYFLGYMVAVPVLGSLTDRVDARTVWLGACALAGLGALGFAVLADRVWTAALLQFVTGAGLAGTYMPGLKVMTDRLASIPRPRHVAFYTTSFTLGASFSFWIVGWLDAGLDWRTAVALLAAGPFAGCGLVLLALGRVPVASHAQSSASVHLRAVLHSRDSMRYVAGYAAHVWELFALRAWVVPFVMFCNGLHEGRAPLAGATIAALVSLVGVPASMAGAELTGYGPRRRVITTIMLSSIVVSLLVVPAAHVSWTVLILAVCAYSAFISADSAALTSGLVDVAPPASRGTAMAVYSTLGFAAASAGTFAVGWTLDLLGGQSILSWGIAFALMSAPNYLGALTLRRASR
jgi:MFS family permease